MATGVFYFACNMDKSGALTEPNYTASDLKRIKTPVCIAQSELDEFIKIEHAVYLADKLPNAKLKILEGVSHLAPLQNPELFATEIINFFI